ncbi:SEC-C metal-binding domain-containing protein, partial [Streptococcus suis]
FEGVDRNDPCPCQSGKTFKNCPGRNEDGRVDWTAVQSFCNF